MPVDFSKNDPKYIGKGTKAIIPPPGSKWSKAQVHYQDEVAPGGCRRCYHFDPRHSRCDIVAGFVRDYGVCDYFDEPTQADAPDNPDAAPAPPISQFNAGYVAVKGAVYQCSDCALFQAASRTCQIVEGDINPEGACWEWNSEGGPAGRSVAARAATESLPLQPPLGPEAV